MAVTQTSLRTWPLVAVVAENNPIDRATLAAALSCNGYRVFQADHLNAAISRINYSGELDVLFADIDMPGWETLVKHALNKTPDVFVLAVTGCEPIPEITDLRRHGVHLCMQKPLLYDDVWRVLSANVKARQAA